MTLRSDRLSLLAPLLPNLLSSGLLIAASVVTLILGGNEDAYGSPVAGLLWGLPSMTIVIWALRKVAGRTKSASVFVPLWPGQKAALMLAFGLIALIEVTLALKVGYQRVGTNAVLDPAVVIVCALLVFLLGGISLIYVNGIASAPAGVSGNVGVDELLAEQEDRRLQRRTYKS